MKNLYQSIKEKKGSELNKIKEYYKQGFLPMTLVDNADESDIETFVKRKRQNSIGLKSSSNENLTENKIILNEDFASMLNDKGELQVGDSIYRYTEKGLLITHIRNRKSLDDIATNNKKSLNTSVKLYVPNKNNILDFSVMAVDECDGPGSGDGDQSDDSDDYYGCGGGGGGGSSSTTIPAPDNSGYNVCVNSKAGWVDNIFGKSYVCEYKFNSSFKLRTIFEAADFYFFQDVRAQAKFKQKKLFGWWFSSRDADEVYLLNKKVILKTKRRQFKQKLLINEKDLVAAYDKISALLTSKPTSKVAYVSTIYDLDTNIAQTFEPALNELELAIKQNMGWLEAQAKESKSFLNVNFDLKNFFGKKVDKAIVVNVMGKDVFDISNTDLIKKAYEALSGQDIDLKRGQTGGEGWLS